MPKETICWEGEEIEIQVGDNMPMPAKPKDEPRCGSGDDVIAAMRADYERRYPDYPSGSQPVGE